MDAEEMLELVIKTNGKLHDDITEWRLRAVAAEAELSEARAEITRHHRDFAEVQRLAEKAADCLKRDDIVRDDPDPAIRGTYVAATTRWVQDIRNIVG